MNQLRVDLHPVDWAVILIYFCFVLSIGFVLRRYMKSSEDFLLSGRSIPSWVTGLAFLSANLGALEVMGMAGNGYKYGLLTAHFYWIGAIPAMLFVGIFMMPFYYGSRARSVPESLKLRFDEKTRGLNALSFAVLTLLMSGINMYAMALVFEVMLGWSIHVSIGVSAAVVLGYTYLGGLTSSIYNEVLQFFLIVFGFAPLSIVSLEAAGGFSGIEGRLARVPGMTHIWSSVGHAADNPMGIEVFGLVMGLGFVLSFGYWCTDFLVVQRALASRDMLSAQRTPLIAAVPKLLFPFLVILPGLAAALRAHLAERHLHPPDVAQRLLGLRPPRRHQAGVAQHLLGHLVRSGYCVEYAGLAPGCRCLRVTMVSKARAPRAPAPGAPRPPAPAG